MTNFGLGSSLVISCPPHHHHQRNYHRTPFPSVVPRTTPGTDAHLILGPTPRLLLYQMPPEFRPACLGRNSMLTPLYSSIALPCSNFWDFRILKPVVLVTLCASSQLFLGMMDFNVLRSACRGQLVSQGQRRVSTIKIYSLSSHFSAINHSLGTTWHMTSSIPIHIVCSLYSETCCLGLRRHYFSRIKSKDLSSSE